MSLLIPKPLFEPMVGIRLVVECLHFLVSRVPVHLDRFNKRAVRLQVKDRDTRLPGGVFQFQQEAPSEPETTYSWSDPHALQLPDRVLMKLYGATAHRLLSQASNKQQTGWGRALVRVRRNGLGRIETRLETLAQFGEVLLNAPPGILTGWIGDADLDH